MHPAALPLNFVQIASECRSPKVYEKDELTLLIRQTKDSELKFARGGARHRAGLRSAGSAEAVLSGPHKILCLYHNAFPRYYQLVPVEAVSHQKSPLKKKFPGFCPSERNPRPFRKYPVGVVQHTAAGPLRAPVPRDAHGAVGPGLAR